MTFLEICQRLKRECAISGTLTGVASQSGELQRMIEWAASAYDDICSMHQSWKFLRSSFTVNTVNNDDTYDVTDFTDSRASVSLTVAKFSHWWWDTFRIYLQSAGVATQTFLSPMEYDVFRDIYLFGSPPSNFPIKFTVRPDDSAIILGPKPNGVYVLTGDYQKVAVPLTADAHTPLFPARFHMAVVWLAARRYAGYEEDGGLYDHANREYARLLAALEQDQLPAIEMPYALA